jgi:hypothetical protein
MLFNDGTYRWFDEKQYRICSADGTTADGELLGNLIGQPSYESSAPLPSPSRSGSLREQFEFRLNQMQEGDRVHGPYWLRCVTPDRFDAVDLATARERLMAWGQIGGDGIPPKGMQEVERLEEIAGAATGLFWLQDLDDQCSYRGTSSAPGLSLSSSTVIVAR